jgi:hypothetical protein
MYPSNPNFLARFPIDNQYDRGTQFPQLAKLVSEAKREGATQQRAHSRLALCTLLKFRTCAEGRIAREWTCWKPRSKTHDRVASSRPPTIQRTLYNTTCGRAVALRDSMPFLTSAW